MTSFRLFSPRAGVSSSSVRRSMQALRREKKRITVYLAGMISQR
jgi:hypothetical protein